MSSSADKKSAKPVTGLDGIVVPGGGLTPDGELPPWTIQRLDLALSRATGREYIITLSAGTLYKPMLLEPSGRVIFESVRAAQYLSRRGYDSSLILAETSSYDTIGNAFFCRTIHTDPLGLQSLLVITSDFHMPRTEALFRWVYQAAPETKVRLQFAETETTCLQKQDLEARIAKEKSGLLSAQKVIALHPDLAAIHRFLFTEHDIYATGRWQIEQSSLSPEVLRSY